MMNRIEVHPSYDLAHLAAAAVERASSQPQEAVTAILLSSCFLEAFINDFITLLAGRRSPRPPAVDALVGVAKDLEEARIQFLARFQTAYFVLSGRPITKGASPYQDLQLLHSLRNALVHGRTEVIALEPKKVYQPNRLIAQLVARRAIDPPPENAIPYFTFYLKGQPLAKWAYLAATASASELVRAVPDPDSQELLFVLFPFLQQPSQQT